MELMQQQEERHHYQYQRQMLELAADMAMAEAEASGASPLEMQRSFSRVCSQFSEQQQHVWKRMCSLYGDSDIGSSQLELQLESFRFRQLSKIRSLLQQQQQQRPSAETFTQSSACNRQLPLRTRSSTPKKGSRPAQQKAASSAVPVAGAWRSQKRVQHHHLTVRVSSPVMFLQRGRMYPSSSRVEQKQRQRLNNDSYKVGANTELVHS